jgi:dTDP-4-dehydrorhamnose reductase
MRRPLYSVLANTRARALGISLPPWHDALARYLKERHPNGPPGDAPKRVLH